MICHTFRWIICFTQIEPKKSNDKLFKVKNINCFHYFEMGHYLLEFVSTVKCVFLPDQAGEIMQ